MTIALAITTNEGIVLVADTMRIVTSQGVGVVKPDVRRYIGADKVFPLSARLPLGLLTCGEGAIGHVPLAVIVAHFASMNDGCANGVETNGATYSVRAVAELFQKNVFEDHYKMAYGNMPVKNRPEVGLIVAGFSAGSLLPEIWNCTIDRGGTARPVTQERHGIWFAGEPEAIHRLLRGVGVGYFDVLGEVCSSATEATMLQSEIQRRLTVRLWHPLMPLRDAVELAEFLVYAESMFSRFAHVGFSSVGGGIDIATITHGGGFRIGSGHGVLHSPRGQRSRISRRRASR